MSLMSNLRHPHIVRFLGACLEPLQMSILFELCATSLYGVLHVQKQPLQLEYALSLIRQIALGIFYLHQCKEPVLHLDLKSANVLLDEHGVAKVADFGLSHIKKETAVITARMGSPQWTAPEILRGQPHDESADTYSFGVLLYEIMAARLPYEGVDTFQVVMGVITKMLPRPELSADCAFPSIMQELMQKCWSESPSDRPRFNTILDKADEALEHLALRPQLAGAGARTAAHAFAHDLNNFAKARSPPGSQGANTAATAGAAGCHTPEGSTPPPTSSQKYGSFGSAGRHHHLASNQHSHGHHSVASASSGSAGVLAAVRRAGFASPGVVVKGVASPGVVAPSGRAAVSVAIALVDHVGQAFEELSFKRGDTIRDVEASNAIPTTPASPLASLAMAAAEGGLYRGTLRGRQGYFRGEHVCMSTIGPPPTTARAAEEAGNGVELRPLELLRELRDKEELLQAREIQVAALKAMKKREEQTKLIERNVQLTLSRHIDAWRRVTVEQRASRELALKDEQIKQLAERIRQMAGT